MSRRFPSRSVLLVVVAMGAAMTAASPQAGAAKPAAWGVANVGAYGGEPSLATDPKGVLYDTTPSGGMVTYRSTSHGKTWKSTATADTSSGDDCVSTDQTGAIYECNLAGSSETTPL